MSLPRQLYSAADVRELDRRAIEQLDISGEELMERAGRALFRVLRERLPAARRVLVLCGAGNNGGDGYVVARLARAAGLDVVLVATVAPGKPGSVAEHAMQVFRNEGGTLQPFSRVLLNDADVVIDALLGTGLDRNVEGVLADIIGAVNESAIPVMAADIPSGLHADTGRVLGVAVQARYVVSFIGLKAGLFTGQGPAVCGEVLFDALDLPVSLADGIAPLATRLEPSDLRAELPARDRDAHKGRFGRVLVVGGGAGMPGAARLAGEAALCAGAGRVTTAVWPGNVAAISGQRPELMCRGVEGGSELDDLSQKADVLAVGPGLGQDDWSETIWDQLSSRQFASRVLDADALNWLTRKPLPLTGNDIITPHPGEAARLLDCTVEDIEADRFAAVRALVTKFGCVAVLKGAGTLVAGVDAPIRLCDRGNPGMASAGMGDVLTGLIAGLHAQGLPALGAACAGVLAHALAGDRAARAGERGLLASDLLDELRVVVNPVSLGRTGTKP